MFPPHIVIPPMTDLSESQPIAFVSGVKGSVFVDLGVAVHLLGGGARRRSLMKTPSTTMQE